jgi:hypothetical protein
MEPVNDKNIQYERARKRVKEIKGFYIHTLVFVLVNLFLILSTSIKYDSFETFFQQNQFWGIGLWGIGLFAHGLSVFLPNFILGKNWEEKKIRELMERNRNLKI